ncbi:hypothetical protein Patl1_35295 [Pistacia atlantica]|nr:hypothetical protein Patl1_35295 [Pistacia atlantica]
MLQNQNSQNRVTIHPPPQNHCAQISNLRNLFYQHTLLPNNYMQNPSFQNPNPATMQNHQAVLCYPPNINSNAIFLSGQYGQSTPRRYGRFDNVLYGQSSPPGHQFLGRGQTAAYNPRHSGALSNLSHDLSDLSGPDQFNLSTLTSGSNFNNFLQRRSHFSGEFSREYSAGPSSSRNRSIRVDLLGSAGRSINESHIVLPSSSSRGRARGRQHSSYTSLEELRGRVCLAAKDQKECRFLQKKVDERNPMDITIIFMEVKDDLPELMVHRNYVVQYILEINIPQVTADVLSQFSGSYFTLSLSKYASNVVEKCMKFATEEQLTAIVSEIIHHPDILDLMLNNFGNFVIQSAWKRCKGRPLGQTLLNLVQEHYPLLQSHMYGKKGLSDSIILVVTVIVFLLSRYRVEM